MRPGDPEDPLLRQVLPLGAELESPQLFGPIPLATKPLGKLRDYFKNVIGRVLLLTSGTCGIHCRYCFRRHFPYQDDPKGLEELEPAFRRIEKDPTIREVILSGGDPLTRTDSWLRKLGDRINRIPHIEVVRVHTRLPVVLPDRVESSSP